jgi:Rps23 Pro-64 3,4-dihydroxylase Tpa1-like proline 4-hydroxylase
MSEENKEQNQQDAGKVAKAFDRNMERLVALLGGKDLLMKAPKLGGEPLNEAVKELVKEQKEKMVKDFKEKAMAVITSKQAFDKLQVEKQREFDKAINDKKKEFNKEVEGLFAMIDKIENLEKSYYETLRGMATSPETPAQSNEAPNPEEQKPE